MKRKLNPMWIPHIVLLIGFAPFLNLPKAESLSFDDVMGAPAQFINSLAGGGGQPLPVPQEQPPIGTQADINPCAPAPSSVDNSHRQVAIAPEPTSDPRSKVLDNVRPGQTLRGLQNRIGYPDEVYTPGEPQGYQDAWVGQYHTSAGTYRLVSRDGRLVAIQRQ